MNLNDVQPIVAIGENPRLGRLLIEFCRRWSSAGSHRIVNARAMNEEQRIADLETLARMAARIAGRDPDDDVEVRMGEVVAFAGPMWRYPDFLNRASKAYELLHCGAVF